MFGVSYFLNPEIWKKHFFTNSQILIHVILKGLLSWDSCMFSLGAGAFWLIHWANQAIWILFLDCPVWCWPSQLKSVSSAFNLKNCDNRYFASPKRSKKYKMMMLGAHTVCSTEHPLGSVEKQMQAVLQCSHLKRWSKDFY